MGFVVAERVLYTPSMGFCLALATFLVDGLALAAFVPLLEEEGLFEESFVSSSPPALPNDEAVAALAATASSSSPPSSPKKKKKASKNKDAAGANSDNISNNNSKSNSAKKGGGGAGVKGSSSQSPSSQSSSPPPNALAWAIVVARLAAVISVLACYGATTFTRNKHWRRPEALWRSGVMVNPRNGMLWYNLGHEVEDRAQYTYRAAMEELSKGGYRDAGKGGKGGKDDGSSEGHDEEERSKVVQAVQAAAAEERSDLLQAAWNCFSRALALDPEGSDAATMLGIMALRANMIPLAKVINQSSCF